MHFVSGRQTLGHLRKRLGRSDEAVTLHFWEIKTSVSSFWFEEGRMQSEL